MELQIENRIEVYVRCKVAILQPWLSRQTLTRKQLNSLTTTLGYFFNKLLSMGIRLAVNMWWKIYLLILVPTEHYIEIGYKC